MKRCPRCKVEKPPEEFAKWRRAKDGLNTYCKPCASAIRRKFHTEASNGGYRKRSRTPAAPTPTVVLPVAADDDFLADLDEALLEDQTLRGRESAFERIQLHLYGQ